MARIIVFDVNETLLNVRHLEPLFAEAFGDRAALREWVFALAPALGGCSSCRSLFRFCYTSTRGKPVRKGSFSPSTAQSEYSKEWPRCPRIPRFLTRINRYGMADFDW